MKKLLWLALAGTAVVAAVTALAATAAVTPGQPRPPATTGRPSASPTPEAVVPLAPLAPYANAVDVAHASGLHVWIEADLVKRWLAGKQSFADGVTRIATLAARPGVTGIKFADELGYNDGLDSSDKVRAFLAESAAALRAAAPGKQLLVDLLVPELGCAPDHAPPLRWATICAVQQRGKYPALALDQVDSYLGGHFLDAVDLSTNLQSAETYSGWGLDQDEAQRTAWQEARKRGWDRLVRLQARKALAHPGRYTATDTDATVNTFVDIPRAEGAAAVDVWTWRQSYQGQVYRLLDPGLQRNALWDALASRRVGGAVLFTHLSPSSVEVGLDTDLHKLAEVFTDVFVASGTG